MQKYIQVGIYLLLCENVGKKYQINLALQITWTWISKYAEFLTDDTPTNVIFKGKEGQDWPKIVLFKIYFAYI